MTDRHPTGCRCRHCQKGRSRLERSIAATIAARRNPRRRCEHCGSFLTVQGECRHPDCEGRGR